MRRLGFLVLVAVLVPAAVSAQSAPQLRAPNGPKALPGAFFAATIGVSATDVNFDQDIEFTLFAEDATIRGPVAVPRAPRYEAQLGFRIWRRIGMGLALTYFQHEGDMRADFRLPSPFQVGAPVEVSATTSASRMVGDVHLQVLVGLVASRSWHVVAFAGPSATYLEQEFGHNLFAYQYQYPFTDATLTTRTGATTGYGIGGHVGGSVTRRLVTGVGLTATVRFSSTKADLEAFGKPFQLDTGGTQFSAGIRFGF